MSIKREIDCAHLPVKVLENNDQTGWFFFVLFVLLEGWHGSVGPTHPKIKFSTAALWM